MDVTLTAFIEQVANGTMMGAIYVLVALGLLLFAGNATLTWIGSTRLGDAERPGDPYGGATLEWATSSPPPEDNFVVVPEVRSATPLTDWRAQREGAAE